MTIGMSVRALSGAFLFASVAGAALTLGVPTASAMQLGGFRTVATDDDGVQGAAAFAAGELGGSLHSVDSAQAQTVAGINYRLTITLDGGAVWQVVVYRNLQGEYNLQSSNQVSEGDGPDTGSNDGSDDDN